MINIGLVLAVAGFQAVGLGGRRSGKTVAMNGRQGSVIVDEFAAIDRRLPERRHKSRRFGLRQRNFGIVHVVSPKPETKRARRRRLGRERGARRLAHARHLARCGK